MRPRGKRPWILLGIALVAVSLPVAVLVATPGLRLRLLVRGVDRLAVGERAFEKRETLPGFAARHVLAAGASAIPLLRERSLDLEERGSSEADADATACRTLALLIARSERPTKPPDLDPASRAFLDGRALEGNGLSVEVFEHLALVTAEQAWPAERESSPGRVRRELPSAARSLLETLATGKSPRRSGAVALLAGWGDARALLATRGELAGAIATPERSVTNLHAVAHALRTMARENAWPGDDSPWPSSADLLASPSAANGARLLAELDAWLSRESSRLPPQFAP
jgi:hypothetical protein